LGIARSVTSGVGSWIGCLIGSGIGSGIDWLCYFVFASSLFSCGLKGSIVVTIPTRSV
jgi:hypothetical protein